MTTFRPFRADEDAILHSERRWPMTVHIEAHLDDRVDGARLSRALETVMARHPMTRVHRVRPSRFAGAYLWELSPPDGTNAVAVQRHHNDVDDVRDAWVSQRLDLRQPPPFRILVSESDTGETIIFLLAHHAAFDALGALVLLKELLHAYAEGAQPGDDHESADPAPLEVADGAPLRAAGAPGSGGLVSTLLGGLRSVRPILTATRSIRVMPHGSVTVSGNYVVVLDRVEADRTEELRNGWGAQRVPGATLNDVLVAALHQALAEWARGSDPRTDLVTVTIPVTERSRGQHLEGIQNAGLQARTETRSVDRVSLENVLEAIVSQTNDIKQRGTASSPATALGQATFVPVAIRAQVPRLVSVITRDRYLDTMRLSNLGSVDFWPTDGSTAGVKRLWFTPPARHPQGLNIGAVQHDGALHLAFRACHGPWTRSETQRFAAVYRGVLDRFT